MLFPNIIIGPIKSRRLGRSLGVNLLYDKAKICSFDCIYCECGFNFQNSESHQPSRYEVYNALKNKLEELLHSGEGIDVITFAGNGEPTTHKYFPEIIDDTISLRNKYFPEAKISVLSNSTMIWKKEIVDALNKVDNNILKLDSAIDYTVKLINQPCGKYSTQEIIKNLASFDGNVTIQTLFLTGQHNGNVIDNTTEIELNAWLEALKIIKPKEVMIYSLDRPTPEKNLQKVDIEQLKAIALRVEELGIPTRVN